MKTLKTLAIGSVCALMSLSTMAAEQVSMHGLGQTAKSACDGAKSSLLARWPNAYSISTAPEYLGLDTYLCQATGYIKTTRQVSAGGHGSSTYECRDNATSRLRSSYPDVYNISMSYDILGAEVICTATGTVNI